MLTSEVSQYSTFKFASTLTYIESNLGRPCNFQINFPLSQPWIQDRF